MKEISGNYKKRMFTLSEENLKFSAISLIGSGKERKTISKEEIIELLKDLQEEGLELVCVNQDVSPPICRIIDREKQIFDEKKKKKKPKKKMIKEERISPSIGIGDLHNKLNLVVPWLKKGMGVKINLFKKKGVKYTRKLAEERYYYILKKLGEEGLKVESVGGLKTLIEGSFTFSLEKKK